MMGGKRNNYRGRRGSDLGQKTESVSPIQFPSFVLVTVDDYNRIKDENAALKKRVDELTKNNSYETLEKRIFELERRADDKFNL